jgi:hypothetical protein
MRTLSLALAAALLLALAAGTRAQDSPEGLVEKAIKAHGGAEKLARLGAMRVKAKGTTELMGQTVAFTAETTTRFPDKMRGEIQFDIAGQKILMVQVRNGDKAWMSAMGQTQELPGPLLDDLKESRYTSQVESLVPLTKDRSFKLEALGEAKVDGKPAKGIKVSSKGHKDVKLYFDQETGLLVKSEHRGLDPTTMKDVVLENLYSDFKDFDGLKQPQKVVVQRDGKKYMAYEVEEVKFPDKFDDALFAKP